MSTRAPGWESAKWRTRAVLPTPASPPTSTSRPAFWVVTASSCSDSTASCSERSSRTPFLRASTRARAIFCLLPRAHGAPEGTPRSRKLCHRNGAVLAGHDPGHDPFALVRRAAACGGDSDPLDLLAVAKPGFSLPFPLPRCVPAYGGAAAGGAGGVGGGRRGGQPVRHRGLRRGRQQPADGVGFRRQRVARGPSPATRRVDCFNFESSAWVRLPDLPRATSGAGAATLDNGIALILGGENAQETTTSDQFARLPNPSSWAAAEAMLIPRHGFELAVFEDRAWACGGGALPGLHPVAACTSVA